MIATPRLNSKLVWTRSLSLLLALTTLILYLPACFHDFLLLDDAVYVTGNKVVQAGMTWAGIKWALTALHASNWHPLTWCSHMLDCELFGLNASAHHFINVLWHSANTVLMFLLWRRLTGAVWCSAFVAAAFAWHPLRVESVAWVSERKDVLSAFFGLLTLLAYTHHASRITRYTATERPTSFSIFHFPFSRWLWLAVACFALSLMAKPMLVTLPFVLLLLDYWPLQRLPSTGGAAESLPNSAPRVPLRQLILEKSPFFLLAAASCVLTVLAQRAEAVVGIHEYPLVSRVANASVSYARYLLNLIWPAGLATPYPLPKSWATASIAAAMVVLVAISLFAWITRRRSSYLLMGWLWFLGMLVPVIGLVQVGAQAMADRYTYLPGIGVLLAVVFGVNQLMQRFHWRRTTIALIAGLVLTGLLIATGRQLRFWCDTETLVTRALVVTENNATARLLLGVVRNQQGRRDEALTEFREALRLTESTFTSAQFQQDHGVRTRLILGTALHQQGRHDEALAVFREALQADPSNAETRCALGSLLDETGQFEDAMVCFREAVRLKPEDPRPHFLMGQAELRQGQSSEALAHLREALRLGPEDCDRMLLLAQVLAADPRAEVRNGREALALSKRANRLSGSRQPHVLDVLAMAHAETGDFKQAQSVLAEAIAIASTDGQTNLVMALQERLRRYQAGQPYRESFTNFASRNLLH